jgi:hypothetical protein
MVMLTSFGVLSSNAQDIKQKIDKAIKDPKAKENSAKADVYTVKKKKTIIDSTKIAAKPEAIDSLERKRKSPKK